MRYEVQDHLGPKALVKSANLLLEGTAKAEAGSPGWAELRRRLGLEMNGRAIHRPLLREGP